MIIYLSIYFFFNCKGYTILSVCLLLIGFTSDAFNSMILITIGIGFSGLIASGWRINHQDIACSYAGILAGISSSIGDSAGILSPIVAGYMTKHQVFIIFIEQILNKQKNYSQSLFFY